MSGFVCILNPDAAPVDADLLRRMTDAMADRGPDAQRIWIDGFIGLGHTLLSTTWESEHETQPLGRDGRLWITGDVRLDRREELMARLRGHGSQLAAAPPDVDLVLRAFAVWGDGCLEHLAGDFAFVIWGARERRLFCARDHFGICPLYYASLGNGLIIANDIEGLRLHPEVSDRLNERTIGDFVLFAMNMDRATTVYEDIAKLPPAHRLTWSRGRSSVACYWRMPEEIAYVRYRHPEEYVERFRELFERAVADRLRTERAGSHLSGGLDASSIAVTAHRLMRTAGGPVDLRTYTIVYRELCEEEEGAYSRLVAEQEGFPMEELVADDFLRRSPLDTETPVPPEPFMIPGMTAEWEIQRRVSGFCRTLFAGFGGDPVFGFKPGHWFRLLCQGRVGDLVRDLADYRQAYQRLPPTGLRTAFRQRVRVRLLTAELPEWINPDFAERVALLDRWRDQLSQRHPSPQQSMATSPLWPNIFVGADPGFCGIPVKLRFPFFDLRLIAYLGRVPAGAWFTDKRLLREAMRSSLPQELLRRPKTPLGMSHYHNLAREGPQPWLLTLIADPALLFSRDDPHSDRVLFSRDDPHSDRALRARIL